MFVQIDQIMMRFHEFTSPYSWQLTVVLLVHDMSGHTWGILSVGDNEGELPACYHYGSESAMSHMLIT